jgi:cytochrome P450
MSVLLAGRDSTACTLAWMFLELAQNQSIVDKLRHEVLFTIGDTAAPSYEQLKSMKYLQNTINETLRLYPLLAVNGRMTLRDTTLPRGGGENGLGPIGMPAGTMIWYTAYSLQMQAEAYPAPGEVNFIDPLKFEPDRWKTWTPKPWYVSSRYSLQKHKR